MSAAQAFNRAFTTAAQAMVNRRRAVPSPSEGTSDRALLREIAAATRSIYRNPRTNEPNGKVSIWTTAELLQRIDGALSSQGNKE